METGEAKTPLFLLGVDMQMKSKAANKTPDKRGRGREGLKVVSAEFIPTLEARGRLSQVYDLLFMPRPHEDEGQDSEG